MSEKYVAFIFNSNLVAVVDALMMKTNPLLRMVLKLIQNGIYNRYISVFSNMTYCYSHVDLKKNMLHLSSILIWLLL